MRLIVLSWVGLKVNLARSPYNGTPPLDRSRVLRVTTPGPLLKALGHFLKALGQFLQAILGAPGHFGKTLGHFDEALGHFSPRVRKSRT
jgi:hypothetical protein